MAGREGRAVGLLAVCPDQMARPRGTIQSVLEEHLASHHLLGRQKPGSVRGAARDPRPMSLQEGMDPPADGENGSWVVLKWSGGRWVGLASAHVVSGLMLEVSQLPGTMTASITWITPLEASMSTAVTVAASLIRTAPFCEEIERFPPWTVSA